MMNRFVFAIALLGIPLISGGADAWEPPVGWQDVGAVQEWMDVDAQFRRVFQPKDLLGRERMHVDYRKVYAGTAGKLDSRQFPPLDLQSWANLSSAEQEQRRKLASAELRFVVHFRYRLGAVLQETRQNKYSRYGTNLVTGVDALGDCLSHLETAVILDPTHPQAWHLLAYFSRCVGDLARTGKALTGAQAALDLIPASALTEIRTRVALDVAWLHYDYGDYELCLIALDQAVQLGSTGLEPPLMRGLVAARTGDIQQAKLVASSLHTVMIKNWNVALDLNPQLNAPVDNLAAWTERPSSFAENWIMAVAWLKTGQPRLAALELGQPNEFDVYPLAWRFFEEIGAIYLATGQQTQALSAWGRAFMHLPYLVYFPVTSYACDLSNLQLSSGAVPYFLGFDRFHLCGSNLAYGSALVPLVRTAELTEDKHHSAALALERLEICQKQGVLSGQAAVVQSQIYYLMEDREAALAKLESSIQLLTDMGQDDRFSGLRQRLVALKGDLRADFLSMLHSQSGASPGRWEDVLDPEEHLARLQAAHDEDPTQGNRLALARGHIRFGQPEIGRRLLFEGVDPQEVNAEELAQLSTEKLLLVLEADRSLGRIELALELVEGLQAGWAAGLDRVDIWAMAGFICLDHDLREAGHAALTKAVELDPTNRGLQLQLQLNVLND